MPATRAGNKPIEITEPNVLVVEGRDDKNFFVALINHMGLQGIQVMGIGGKNELPGRLKGLVRMRGFRERVVSLGVVRDADDNADDTFKSVCGALRGAGLPVPQGPLESVKMGGQRQVTVMILPVRRARGALEDVCLSAVEQKPAMRCVDEYFDCLKREGCCWPREISKAKVHAFLASRPDPKLRLGEAAKRGYWPWNDSAFNQVKTFLQQVCL